MKYNIICIMSYCCYKYIHVYVFKIILILFNSIENSSSKLLPRNKQETNNNQKIKRKVKIIHLFSYEYIIHRQAIIDKGVY